MPVVSLIGALGSPTWRFLPKRQNGALYLGVELEVDDFPAPDGTSLLLGKLPNYKKEFIMKYDGTLTRGIEIVSHPATLDYHEQRFGWDKVLAIVVENKGKDRKNCGLHIHFNKNFFSDLPYTMNKCFLKLLYISKAYEEPLYEFSRRSTYGYLRHPNYSLKWVKDTKVKDARNSTSYIGRGYPFALHSHYPTTIEVRLFNSTVKLQELFGAFELTTYIATTAKTMRIADLHRMSWAKFIGEIDPDKYPFLVKELVARKVG